MKITRTIGNTELWEQHKTLFLNSKYAPFSCYESVFQWVEDFDKNGCAVCFNTTELEAEVLKALLVLHVPTVLVVAGHFYDPYNVQIETALKEKRMLIMELQRERSDGNGRTARLRNQYVISLVQHIVCGYIDPNGSIVGLLAGKNNVTYLDYCRNVKAEEDDDKPVRWTVAEDKRLLRMFYEDMGIHAIHKAIQRPYSTIYSHLKSLTMDDELLKGREFEDYVVDFFDIPKNRRLTLKEWRSDKSIPGVYPENNSAPDLVFSYEGEPFAIECKWRSHLPTDLEKDILPSTRLALFRQYAKEHATPIFLLLGVGGLPSDPENLYLTTVSQPLTLNSLLQHTVKTPSDILQQLETVEG